MSQWDYILHEISWQNVSWMAATIPSPETEKPKNESDAISFFDLGQKMAGLK